MTHERHANLPEATQTVIFTAAKAMFAFHAANTLGMNAQDIEAAFMLEEDVQHYWWHLAAEAVLAIGALDEDNLGDDTQPLSVGWAVAQVIEDHPEPAVLAYGVEDDVLLYAEYLTTLETWDDDTHCFLVRYVDGEVSQ